MNSLFGVELPTPVNFVIAFVFVLLLIGAAAWLVRRFGATRIDAAARGRQPRLAVIDSAAVDGRRKLVIIRRDNVEHLLMIGGPSDVVVETNIVRGDRRRDPRRERPPRERQRRGRAAPACRCPIRRRGRCSRSPCPRRRSQPAPPPPRTRAPQPTTSGDAPVEPADRPRRRSPRDSRRCARPTRSAGLADELAHVRPSRRADRSDQRPAASAPPASCRARAAARSRSPAADQSLAEMAQRLEAALRRPMAQEGRRRDRSASTRHPSTSKPAAPKPAAAAAQRRPEAGSRAISNKRWRAF